MASKEEMPKCGFLRSVTIKCPSVSHTCHFGGSQVKSLNEC